MSNKRKMIVLLANWYSGATLLTILLNNHSKIVSNGEGFPFNNNDMTRYKCSCGKYLDECQFYCGAASHMKSQGSTQWDRALFVCVPTMSRVKYIDRILQSPRLDGRLTSGIINTVEAYRSRLSRFLLAQYEFMQKALVIANASVYMDGTKSIRRAQLFARDDVMRLQVINLVRDGRAFCYSYIKNRKLNKEYLARAAKEWREYIYLSDKFHADYSHIDYLSIRYEDLCDQPEETLENVFNFLELPYEDVLSRPDNEMHILGNRMRNNFNGKVKKNTNWERALNESDMDVINSVIGYDLNRFGYV